MDNIVHNVIPASVEREVVLDPFLVLCSDDLLMDYDLSVIADLVNALLSREKLQLSVVEIDVCEISKYGVVVPDDSGLDIVVWVKKPVTSYATSNLAFCWMACPGTKYLTHLMRPEFTSRRENTIGYGFVD